MLRAWWLRARGRLEPKPFPHEDAATLVQSGRRLISGPRKILDGFGIADGERVLEIGPGVGYYSVEATRRVGARGRLVCLDLQREMLRDARDRVRAADLPPPGCIQASGQDLPLASESFDRVFLIAVLGEIPDRAKALGEIHRVLAPGGRLSVSEQLPDPDFITRSALRSELSGAGFVEEDTRGRLIYTSNWRKST